MNKTTILGLTIGVLVVAVITQATVSMLDSIALARPPGKSGCKSNFWSIECCWYTVDERTGKIFWECRTCLDNGDGTYRDCTVVSEPAPRTNAGGLPKPGGIFQGDEVPTPGPSTQE